MSSIDVELTTSKLLGTVAGVRHGFTTRRSGVGSPPYDALNMGLHVGDDEAVVVENRRRALAALGFTLEDWVSGEQVHGARVVPVTAADRGRGAVNHAQAVEGADGLITDSPGVLLAGYFADCVPLLVVDPKGLRVGIGHAGWRGTVDNIAGTLIQSLVDAYGSDPTEVVVWIGPAIGPCCFQVGPEVAERFQQTGLGAYVRRGEGLSIDLPAVNKHLLVAAGVPIDHIEVSQVCTACHTDRFFSHRALGPKTGRMAALIGIART